MTVPFMTRRLTRHLTRGLLAVGLSGIAAGALAAYTVEGVVVDHNGNPVAQAQILYERAAGIAGANVITVFSDGEGEFSFPQPFTETLVAEPPVRARALGHEFRARSVVTETRDGQTNLKLTLIMDPTLNQVSVAPASAWLARFTDRRQQSQFVMDCIDCHQVPASEVRAYAGSIADVHAPDPAAARLRSWQMIVQYMNHLSAWEFSRGSRDQGAAPEPDAVYSVDNGERVARQLAEKFPDRLDEIHGYTYGAPLAVNRNTAIYEYEIPEPNAIREAMLLGANRELWVADVSSNRMFTIDLASGRQRAIEVPVDVPIGPHSMHRDGDGALWITPLFNNIVSRVNPDTLEWSTWNVRAEDGRGAGIHDLSFGSSHELLTDAKGRIWFSDIGNNGVGFFDPQTGHTELFAAPRVPGRDNSRAMLYGLVMNRERNQIWYSQLGIGSFGGFDIEKMKFFDPVALPDPKSGPRRITISDEDIMYIALYGAGQLLEFDTRKQRILGTYDLPDTASAPYTATWDPVRQVVWVGTANGDVIYRFDPKDKSFKVLPLPREQAFLRMIDIDPETGVLVTSYANIIEIVSGPRMALIVDPGDGAYPKRFSPDGASPAAKE